MFVYLRDDFDLRKSRFRKLSIFRNRVGEVFPQCVVIDTRQRTLHQIAAQFFDRVMAQTLRKKLPVHGVASPMSLLEVSPAGPSIDAIFQAFDGQAYEINGSTCRVEVYGVHADGCCQWVQLAIDGEAQKLITLRLCTAPEPGSGFISKIA